MRRDRFVADGVHEDVMVTSHVAEEQELTLELRFGSDFADVMEAQQGGEPDRRGRAEATLDQDERSVKLAYDSILFADGRRAEPPIATCENQAYAYDARQRAARLARELWHDEPLAERLEAAAADLRERFNRHFWNEERGTFLLALAGPEKARVEHDSALVAEGMRRYGFRDQATRLACAVLDAAEAFMHQLPEVFAGFARDDANAPIRYPNALTPQAWAAAAPLLALRTLLGLDPDGDELRCAPHLPERFEGLRLEGVRFRVWSRA